ncbi:MAG: helical backbone metal receptor [Candidatus Cloacimonadales bacterium]|nr:helical backbone metal receptor [Candidatus Cloacimonadales bacterium]
MSWKLAAIVSVLVLLVGCVSSNQKASEKRYVITSPEIAEIVCLLEGAENIVGITAECNFPEYLQQKEIVGNFGKVNFEKIIELNPTVVFTAGLEQNSLAAELNKLDYHAERIHSKSVEEMLDSILKIGKIIDCEKRSIFVVDSLKSELQNIQNYSYKPRVFMEIYGDPIMSASDSSFVGQLVALAGGKNIFEQLPRDYCRIDPELVIKANPEIIILTYPGISADDVKNRKGWEVISAVQNDRIYSIDEVDPDLILRASPRIILGIKELQKVFHEAK